MITLKNGYRFTFAAASGALGYDGEGWPWEWPLRWAGCIDPSKWLNITKTLTHDPTVGNLRWYAPWRCVRLAAGGAVNAVGLSNPGFPWWIENVLPRLRYPTAVSIMPKNLEEMKRMGDLVESRCRSNPNVKAVEYNFSCVGAETRILTADGYVRIGEQSDQPGIVLTDSGRRCFSGIVFQGCRETLDVRTANSGRWHVTDDHLFRVAATDGDIVWKRADEIIVGDHLLCVRGDQGMTPEDRGLSPSLWQAIGHMYGDGWRYAQGNCAWCFPESESELVSVVQELLASSDISSTSSFRCSEQRNGVNRNQGEHVLLCRSDVITAVLPPFAKHGEWRSHGLPDALWTSGKQQISRFLRGLFTADGHVGQSVMLTTKYRRLAMDIRNIMLLFGIVSKVRRKAQRTPFGVGRAYTVYLVGPTSVRIFNEKIGFALVAKQTRLDMFVRKQAAKFRERTLGHPFAGCVLQKASSLSNPSIPKKLSSDAVGVTLRSAMSGRLERIADSALPKVVERFIEIGGNQTGVDTLRQYIAGGFWFDRVVHLSRDTFQRRVYDVSHVDGGSYVSQGVVSHNCPNVEHDAGVDHAWRMTGELRSRTGLDIMFKAGFKQPYLAICKVLSRDHLADVFDLINTVLWGDVFPQCPSPLAKYHLEGGVSGQAIKPYAWAALKDVVAAGLGIPILSGGGIDCFSDMMYRFQLGAGAVSFGTLFLRSPWKPLFLIKQWEAENKEG